MNLEQALRWRALISWAGGLACFLAFLALLDGLIGQWREPASVIKLLPGWSAEINGPLLEEVGGIQDLTYVSDSNLLSLTFDKVHKGYFLGGDLWRGQITVGPSIQPGEYHLTVAPRRSTSAQAFPAFRIVVFADSFSLQRSAKSLIRSYTGFSPWGAAAAFAPLILLAAGAVFWLSLKLERLMARQGWAEIYRVINRDGGVEIHFGLGTAHGLQPGLELRVYDRRRKPVGLARVETATPRDAVAVVMGQEIRPGFFISTQT